MIRTIDVYIGSKIIDNFAKEFYKTVQQFKKEAQEWAQKKGYNNYILRGTVTWTKEAPHQVQYLLEVLEHLKK